MLNRAYFCLLEVSSACLGTFVHLCCAQMQGLAMLRWWWQLAMVGTVPMNSFFLVVNLTNKGRLRRAMRCWKWAVVDAAMQQKQLKQLTVVFMQQTVIRVLATWREANISYWHMRCHQVLRVLQERHRLVSSELQLSSVNESCPWLRMLPSAIERPMQSTSSQRDYEVRSECHANHPRRLCFICQDGFTIGIKWSRFHATTSHC